MWYLIKCIGKKQDRMRRFLWRKIVTYFSGSNNYQNSGCRRVKIIVLESGISSIEDHRIYAKLSL